jgi:hypothetical protein
MERQEELVTVFRSAEHSAESEAIQVRDFLLEEGISAELFDDKAPGVPTGAYEVRVPAPDAQHAEELIADRETTPEDRRYGSHEFDLVTAFSSNAHNSEMEATAIHSILEANGIPSLIVGASVYPNLPFEVRVPRNRLQEAQRVIAESQAAGPEAAEEAEEDQESENAE